ncbi:hypothetical protein QT711_05410 [Sporosarcina saromensis]|uniref:Uncharacterized protein n=1 Tax=Sporosarcina saromensis TaxID=359365 RepID=A0ABU4GAK3_9BACL|nr:hypothetical protein [Sporosarcina saromensis]MDW0112612.1 hypothetical protein [Sporosarcina saromensis]
MTPLSIAIGHDNDVYILLVNEHPPLVNGSFPATITEESYYYQVIYVKDGQKTVLHLPNETWNYHHVQPIDNDHVLLVCARSYYHDASNIEENARVYDKNGSFVRSFCLGDGIGKVYVTKDQEIWTGYFDEGVFGNYGWEKPIGRSGLVGWNASGVQIDSLEDDKQYAIFECLALNGTAHGQIIFFFSIDAKFGIRKDNRTEYYSTEDIAFRGAFAVKGDKIVAHQGISGRILFELKRIENEFKTVRKIELIKPDGQPVIPQLVNNREDKLLFLDGDELYLYEMKSGD